MRNWLEESLVEPVISEPRVVEELENRIVVQGNIVYDTEVKAYLQKIGFKTIEKIVQCVIYPLLGTRDISFVVNRVVLALTGLKHKWIDKFEGRKMKKIDFKDNEFEFKIYNILVTWAEIIKKEDKI